MRRKSLKSSATVRVHHRAILALFFRAFVAIVFLLMMSLEAFAVGNTSPAKYFLSDAEYFASRGVASPASFSKESDPTPSSDISQKTVVAIIDSGIDAEHPALSENLWTNEAEARGKDGVDDDGNGYIDDLHGWDFGDRDDDLSDSVGHGTHIAGIIGASPVSSPFMQGVNPGEVEIMMLKIVDGKGKLKLSRLISALEYAYEQNVDVVNMSLGFARGSENLHEILKQMNDAGIALIAAAGNGASTAKNYPAAYEEVIAVGAIDVSGKRWTTSNYGAWVDIAAVGQLYSSKPGDKYGTMSGTSQATGLVTGVYAYYKNQFPEKSASEITTLVKKNITNFGREFLAESGQIKV